MSGGRGEALGVVAGGGALRFRLRSAHATAVELCLFDSAGAAAESRRLPLASLGGGLWETTLSGGRPGQVYGYRVDGPFEPGAGHFFNPAKLLLDPYAAAVVGPEAWHETQRSVLTGSGGARADPRDDARFAPRGLVADRDFDWQGVAAPRIAARDSVIYECHVRGLTRRHPEILEELRGTYLGLAQEPVLRHLRALGVTAVELLPVQHFVSEPALANRGLRNYWGYNPLGLFAPHAGYATAADGRQVTEFKTMVRELHRAGFEVILDVVFNHTCEGGPEGPTLCWRGIDNTSYYRLRADDPGRYDDLSGCGNTLDAAHPMVGRMILDCLRHWVEEYRVDGFRFDLAAALGRRGPAFDREAALLAALREDPALAGVKLIAEPWDLGPRGYQLGAFPRGWAEWNDRYRDTVRSFWRGDPARAGAMREALAGSPATFAPSGRGPEASIEFVTSHDGFTLADLVSYERKHNWPNGEENRDGHDHNLSRNWGVEGETDRGEIREIRDRVRRSLLATLAISAGVPMLSHGDEVGRTQGGNNNAYCQDNEVTWVDWNLDPRRRRLLEFSRAAFALRRRLRAAGPTSPVWLTLAGRAAAPGREPVPSGQEVACLLHGSGETFVILLNAGDRARLFQLPRLAGARPWRVELSSVDPSGRRTSGQTVRLEPHALLVLSATA